MVEGFAVEFDILGPTAVQVDGQMARLGPTNRRALCARFILEANRPVPADQLLAVLAEHPGPAPTKATLRSHVAQLRRILGPERLRTVAGGYQLNLEDNELDAVRFQTELKRAQAALDGGDPASAAVELERGLARWRGPALVDAGGAPWAAPEAHRLNELHLVAEETLLDVHLAQGQHEQVIELALMAIDENPERESLWACLMLALYRCDRVAEAVRTYQRLRNVLRQDDVGRSPSAELVNLERAMLLRDPSLNNAQCPKVLTPIKATTSSHALPGGVVTFLMTDVVGSTRLWETVPAAMRSALARHDELMKIAVESHDGVLVRERGEGDSTFSVFRRVTDGAAAALAAQLSLGHEPWPPGCVLQVRMAIHTGEASERDGDYYGRPVNRVARLRAIAEGGQILVSQSSAEILLDYLPAAATLVALGVKELRDFDRPEAVYLLGFDGFTPAPPATADQLVDEQLVELAATPIPESAAKAATWWQAVVEADEDYYRQSGHKDMPFPQDLDRRVIPLTEPAVLIGRPSSSHDVEPHIDLSRPFEDPGVSRMHAVLERQIDGTYALVDPGSTNGTFLNNMQYPVTRRVQVALSAGDCIYLGFWTRIEIQAQ